MLSMMMVVSFSSSVFAATVESGNVTLAGASDSYTATEEKRIDEGRTVLVNLPAGAADGGTATISLNFKDTADPDYAEAAAVKFTAAGDGYEAQLNNKTAVKLLPEDYRVVYTVENKEPATGKFIVTVTVFEKDAKATDKGTELGTVALKYTANVKQSGITYATNALGDKDVHVYASAFPNVAEIKDAKLYVRTVSKYDGSEKLTPVGTTVKAGDVLVAKYVMSDNTEKAIDTADTALTWNFVGQDAVAGGLTLTDGRYTVAAADAGKRIVVSYDKNDVKFSKTVDVEVPADQRAEIKGIKVLNGAADAYNLDCTETLTVKLYTDAECKAKDEVKKYGDFEVVAYLNADKKYKVKATGTDADLTINLAGLEDYFTSGDVVTVDVTSAKTAKDYVGKLSWKSANETRQLVVKDDANKDVNIPQVGQVLVAKVLDGTHEVTGATYKWFYAGDEKDNAKVLGTNASYLVKPADLGKKLVVVATDNGTPAKDFTKTLKAVGSTDEKAAVEAVSFKIWTKAYKNGIKFNYRTVGDAELDGYQIFRTTKKDGFGKSPIFTKAYPSNNFFNKTVKKGTMYYYKVRGYKVVDGETVYTQWSKVGSRKAK